MTDHYGDPNPATDWREASGAIEGAVTADVDAPIRRSISVFDDETPEPPTPHPVNRSKPVHHWQNIGRTYFSLFGLGPVVVRLTVRWDGRGEGFWDWRYEVRDPLGDLVAAGAASTHLTRTDAQVYAETEAREAIRRLAA
jgi:hypothetical protein